jgi:hypothetical protein
MDRAVSLAHGEDLLREHSPAHFDKPTLFAYAECSEAVRRVEVEEAWRAAYDSLDDFYAAHEERHPHISFYVEDLRRTEAADLFRSPWEGLPSERLERLRREDESG